MRKESLFLIALSRLIDRGNAHRDPEAVTWGRIAKLSEETGEVVEAFIGATGQNPRKGVFKTMEDVKQELLDVAVTALAAYEHMDNHRGLALPALRSKIISVAQRVGADRGEPREEDPRHNIEHNSWDAGGYCNELVVDEDGNGDTCNYRQALPLCGYCGDSLGATGCPVHDEKGGATKPTTADIRLAFSNLYVEEDDPSQLDALFDEWFASEMAKVLEDAAEILSIPTMGPVHYFDAASAERLSRDFLRARAKMIVEDAIQSSGDSQEDVSLNGNPNSEE